MLNPTVLSIFFIALLSTPCFADINLEASLGERSVFFKDQDKASMQVMELSSSKEIHLPKGLLKEGALLEIGGKISHKKGVNDSLSSKSIKDLKLFNADIFTVVSAHIGRFKPYAKISATLLSTGNLSYKDKDYDIKDSGASISTGAYYSMNEHYSIFLELPLFSSRKITSDSSALSDLSYQGKFFGGALMGARLSL